jgi:glycerophosphoryl diester phosphodiesterase
MPILPEWPYPRLVAHRGGGSVAPENTLGAMRSGYERGFRMVEFDVKLTSDHHSILLHDTTLERTTNGTGVAGDHSLSELLQLDAGSWHSGAFAGETIPTLRAIARYTQANGIASNIEIKPTPGQEVLTGELVTRQVQRDWSGASLKPLLSSFSVVSLKTAMIEAPELPRGLIADVLPENWQQLLAELACVSVHLKHTSVTSETVTTLHKAGYRLAVWTVNEPARAQELLNWGVDAVITDAIDRISPV